jgi:hypothetical protein
VPAIVVHGVPDTERVWRGVLSRLESTDALERPAEVAAELTKHGEELGL